MSETLTLTLAGLAGSALGAVFFGGLWWTVRRGLTSAHPAPWFLGSLLVRTTVAAGGFFLVGGGQWPRLLACLVGFVAARTVVTRLSRAVPAPLVHVERQGGHAS